MYFGVALLPLLLYLPSVYYDFVWDDNLFIVRNPAVQSWRYVPTYFTDANSYAREMDAQMYRPLRNISYLLDFSVFQFGLRPAGYHAHNIVLHALNSALLLWVLVGLTALVHPTASGHARLFACATGTLVWALHPVNTEAVAWIKSRDELLFTLFYVVSLGVFVRALLRGSLTGGALLGICALFTLSIHSKEMAITLPAALLVSQWLFSKRTPRIPRNTWMLVVALAAITLAYLAARHQVLGRTSQTGYLAGSLKNEMLTMTRAMVRYIRLALLPANLLADYNGYPISHSLLEPRVVLSCGILIAALIVTIALLRCAPLAGFGAVFFFLALLPVSNIVSTMQFLAERFLYLPLVGLAMIVSDFAIRAHVWLAKRRDAGALSPGEFRQRGWLAVALVVLVLGVESLATAVRLPTWKNNLRLYEDTYFDSPDPSWRIKLNYAFVLLERHQDEQALPTLFEIVAQNRFQPRNDQARAEQSLAAALLALNRLEEGRVHAERALKLNPNCRSGKTTLAYYYLKKKDYETGARICREALDFDPTDHAARENLQFALGKLRESNRQTSATLQSEMNHKGTKSPGE